MPKFKVFLRQYVEEVAVMEIEANDELEARDLALTQACEAEWTDGSDSYAAEVSCVQDASGKTVLGGDDE